METGFPVDKLFEQFQEKEVLRALNMQDDPESEIARLEEEISLLDKQIELKNDQMAFTNQQLSIKVN